MADRTSAALFARIFERLADDTPIDRAAFARELFAMTNDYDFNPYQMGCDAALERLDLVRYLSGAPGERDEEAVYFGERGFNEAKARKAAP